jgi:hypothetical protein
MFAVLGFILLAAWLFVATEPSHPRLIHLLPLAGLLLLFAHFRLERRSPEDGTDQCSAPHQQRRNSSLLR